MHLPGSMPFLDPMLANQLLQLCRGDFSNFVIQMVLERGTEQQRERVAGIVYLFAHELVVDDHAASVVTKALRYCKGQGQFLVATSLFNLFNIPPMGDWWLERVARHRHACETLELLQKLNLAELVQYQDSLRQRLSHSWFVKTLKASEKQKDQRLKEKAQDKLERRQGKVREE